LLLRVTVLQYKGAPPPAALAYMFDERGGSIGREDCNLTLPDPTRVLSRVQAKIVFADGLFSLLDQGGNPSLVNSLRVGKDKSRVLYDGDILELGDYKLRVKAIGAAVPKNFDETVPMPMRAFDTMTTGDLAPPILLDPDELVSTGQDNTFATASVEAEPTEMTFDMDVDFDNLDDDDGMTAAHNVHRIENHSAAIGIDSPLDAPQLADTTLDTITSEAMLAARKLDSAMNAHAAMLSGLCLGLGVAAPATGGIPPHHLGIVMRRAMQRALSSVLASFTPQDLEKRLADLAIMDMPPPLDRKSKLWDLFEQRHAEISHAAEDQFHSLFGSEFLKACEAQIDRLQERN